MRPCILNNMYYVPFERVPNLELLKRDLTVQPVWFDRKKPKPKKIFQYVITEDEYIGVPIWFGLQEFPDDGLIDDTSRGQPLFAPKRPDPNHKNASEGQAEFFANTVKWFEENPVGLIKAGTGTGKTANALNLIAERGRSALILTDREYLGIEQWIPEAKEKLGLTDDQIGVIQGDRCEFDKPFCVGITKSILEREDYPEELFDAFGTVIFEELHKFGARRTSLILQKFNAEVKAGQTATTKRKDGCHKIYLDYFGDGQVQGKANAIPIKIKVVDYYDNSGERFPSSHGPRMAYLARDSKRNEVIVREILKMYNEGRNILVIGDDIKHLQRIEQLCWKHGVSENKTGQFSRERYIFVNEAGVHKGQNVIIKRQKKARVTNEYLTWVKQHARIIFATYGMMKEGVDVPRLDGGIDITPRTEGVQVIGRIRRKYEGKLFPLWITIRDTKHDSLLTYYSSRLKDYLSSNNVEVLE